MYGLRNGIYYGAKIRFFHALVMTFLFREGSIKEKIKVILQLTKEHAKNLGIFVFCYKSLVCVLNNLRGSHSKLHNLIAGAVKFYLFINRLLEGMFLEKTRL